MVKTVLPELPAALYIALSLAVCHHWCIFHSELIHTVGLWIADSSRHLAYQIFQGVGDASAMTSVRVFDNSHCAIVTRVNESGKKIGLKACSVKLVLANDGFEKHTTDLCHKTLCWIWIYPPLFPCIPKTHRFELFLWLALSQRNTSSEKRKKRKTCSVLFIFHNCSRFWTELSLGFRHLGR